jgi:DNA-binding transcriptional LysR family regulator
MHLRLRKGNSGNTSENKMNLTDLQTFCLVAKTGTISAAAKRQGVPKSTVSRRVSRLEDALGHELLRRSPRSVSLTGNGQVLYKRSAASLQELQNAADALLHADSEPAGTLRITTVSGFGHSHQFIDCLKSYGLKYPKMTVELELSARLVNLVEEGFDIGVRLHTGTLPGSPSLISRRLLQFGRALYASPSYIQKMGSPNTLNDLSKHRIAAHSMVDFRDHKWKHLGPQRDISAELPTPKWLVNDSTALKIFILSGAGIGLLPKFVGEDLCEKRELIRVLPAYEQQGNTASLIWPASRHLAPRIRAFIDHAVNTIGSTT